MRNQLAICIASFTLLACAPSPAPIGTASQANFINGGFDDGTLTGWTKTNALWGDGATPPGFAQFPPRTVADLNLTTGSGVDLTAVVGAGSPVGLTNADSVTLPFAGTNAAKVNGPIGTAGNHNANIITQSMVTSISDIDSSDNLIHVRFAVVPVLNVAAHNPDQQPYFFVLVQNTTKGVPLYNTFNFSNQPGVGWKTATTSINSYATLYTDWQAFDLAPGPAGIEVGDTIAVTVVASGCAFNAHFGEAYVDEFSTKSVYPSVKISAPAYVAANNDLTYTITAKNNTNGTVTGTTVDFATPVVADSNTGGNPNTVNTTWVSTSATGVTCTNPAALSTGTVTCTIGTLAPGASYTFQVTVHVPLIPLTHTAPDFVNAGSYDIKTDQHPTPINGGLVQTQVTTLLPVDLQTTLTDGVSSVVWGSADTYTLTVTNKGPNAVVGASVVDQRPAQLTAATWTCVGASGGVCNASGSGNINQLVTLPVGAKVTFTIHATVTGGPAAGSFTYRATVTPPAAAVQSFAFDNIGTDTDTASPTLFTLTAAKDATGNGNGNITSQPVGIDCGTTCTADFASGTMVALTANPVAGSVFTGWSGGGCTGTANPCTVTISAATTVTARYDQPSLSTALVTTSNGGSQSVRPGDTATYSLRIQLPPGTTAQPILVSDALPAGLSFVSATTPVITGALTCDIGSCTAPTAAGTSTRTFNFGNVTCTTAGACEIDLTILARIDATTTRGTTLTNSIGVGGLGTPVLPTLTVIEPNLTVSRTANPSVAVVRGQPVTITVTLANNTGGANSSAFDVVATFPIPAGYTANNYVPGTCATATTSFTAVSATFTLPTGAAGSIAAGTSCTFTYDLTGDSTSPGNATVTFPAGTVTSQSITGAAPPAKTYSAPAPAVSISVAAIANSLGCASNTECISMICDMTDHLCGLPVGSGLCDMMNAGVVCRTGVCSHSGVCGPAIGCLVDDDCNTMTQFCNTQTSLCTPKLDNGMQVPTTSGHTPPLTGACDPTVGAAVCKVGVCDVGDDRCGIPDGSGPCASADVCRGGFCSAAHVCGTVGSCYVDADCDTSTQFCDTAAHACGPKIPNGQSIPSIAGHLPALTGACTIDAATAVCVSAVCDTSDQLCGYADGNGSCTPATASTVCRGRLCKSTGVCGSGCSADSDCMPQTQFCNTVTNVCSPKLANGTPIPSIGNHTPTLEGVCTTGVAGAVCLSAVCDGTDNQCGHPDGAGPCTPDNAKTVCRSGLCNDEGLCGSAVSTNAADGGVYGIHGGGFACSMGGVRGDSGRPLLFACVALLLALGLRRRRA